MRAVILLGAFVFLLGVAGTAVAAEGTTVAGQAISPGDEGEAFAVPAAIMTLTSVSDEAQAEAPPTAETNELGVFRFRDVPEGCYIIIGAAEGMQGQSDAFCVPGEEDPHAPPGVLRGLLVVGGASLSGRAR